MTWPTLLAHGALGYWDELIFISIAVIFVFMMGMSWLRSRGLDETPDETIQQNPAHDAASEAERFELD